MLTQNTQHQGIDYLRSQTRNFVSSVNYVAQYFSSGQFASGAATSVQQPLKTSKGATHTSDLSLQKHRFWLFFSRFYVANIRITEMRWGFLFICLTTQVADVDFVSPIDGSSCLTRAKQFVSSWSMPAIFWCDIGVIFNGAITGLSWGIEKWYHMIFSVEHPHTSIKCSFYPPSSSHSSGFRGSSLAVLGDFCMPQSVHRRAEFNTTLFLFELATNARPLTTLSTNPSSLDAAMRPHLDLVASQAPRTPPIVVIEDFNHRMRFSRSLCYSNSNWSSRFKLYVLVLNCRLKW